ncbi:hypothetical protein D3C80_1467870 [compost metagenome]
MLRLALHGSRHQLSTDQGLRPSEGRPFNRRSADGPLGPGGGGGDVFDRHGDWLRQGRADQRRLGLGRERRPGRRRPRRTPGLQAVARPARDGSDPGEAPRRQGAEDDLCARRGASHAQYPHHACRALRLRPRGHGSARAVALGCRHRGPLRLPDGHGVGEGRRERRDLHRPGAARNRAVPPRLWRAAQLQDQLQGRPAGDRPRHRRRRGGRPGLPDRQPPRHRPVR